MRVTSGFGIGLLACAVFDACGTGADYAREGRIVAEIVPAIVVGDAVYLPTPRRAGVLAIFTMPQARPVGGAVIVHGLGVHADWGLISGLRTDLSEAGIATLSMQTGARGRCSARRLRDTLSGGRRASPQASPFSAAAASTRSPSWRTASVR